MRSSRSPSSVASTFRWTYTSRGAPRLVLAAAVSAGLLLAGCSRPPDKTQGRTTANSGSPTPTSVDCVPADGSAVPDAGALAANRQAAQNAPLYTAMAAKAPLASCRVATEGSRMTLSYAFGDGATLRVSRDSSIEYSSQEAHFSAGFTDDPVALLTRAEHGSFGAEGCGIDWRQGEAEASTEGDKATDQVYRGETCNCQARVQRDAGGKIVGLALRSTC